MCGDLVLLLECKELAFSEYQFSKFKVANSGVVLNESWLTVLKTLHHLSVQNTADPCWIQSSGIKV